MDITLEKTQAPPVWAALSDGQSPLDVRAVLARGEDPLNMLVGTAQAVTIGGVMAVDAPFNPSPLRRMLAGMGFSSYGWRLSGNHWRVFFCRDGGKDWERDAEAKVTGEGALQWQEPDGLHVDVRKLPPPKPMLAVLRALESAPVGMAVVMHHERMPQLLLEELPGRGWQVASVTENTADIRVRLERQ